MKPTAMVSLSDINPTESTDAFIDNLPPELRLKVYHCVFLAGTRRHQRTRTAILRTCRLIHQEALPVLYDTCAATVKMVAVVKMVGLYKPKAHFMSNRTLLRHILIKHIRPCDLCTNIMLKTCPACNPAAKALLDEVKTMPRLRSVVVDYHLQPDLLKSFASYAANDKYGVTLVCIGVGRYMLLGLGGIDFSLANIALETIWQALTERLAVMTPRKRDMMRKRLEHLDKYMPRDIEQLLSLQDGHDSTPVIPAAIAKVWPKKLDINLRMVDKLLAADQLHAFNVVLENILAVWTDDWEHL